MPVLYVAYEIRLVCRGRPHTKPAPFNACFDFGIFPSCLKTAKVVSVYKAGDKNEVSNYRRISILSIFCKILDKLVYTRTLSLLKCHSLLTPTQYGFRPKYSTLQALLDIIFCVR